MGEYSNTSTHTLLVWKKKKWYRCIPNKNNNTVGGSAAPCWSGGLDSSSFALKFTLLAFSLTDVLAVFLAAGSPARLRFSEATLPTKNPKSPAIVGPLASQFIPWGRGGRSHRCCLKPPPHTGKEKRVFRSLGAGIPLSRGQGHGSESIDRNGAPQHPLESGTVASPWKKMSRKKPRLAGWRTGWAGVGWGGLWSFRELLFHGKLKSHYRDYMPANNVRQISI